MRHRHLWLPAIAVLTLTCSAVMAQQKRPMSFMDVMEMRTVGSPAISADGKWMLYTLSVPNWQDAKSYTDIHLVSIERGLADTRQMTYTATKNETSPRWSRDGKFFAFLSNRDGGENESQVYVMRPSGGEAQKLSDAKDGVNAFAFSRDGLWLGFSTAKAEDRQIWISRITNGAAEPPQKLTSHATPISNWQFAPDGKSIFFTAVDTFDQNNRERKERKFDVKVRNEVTPNEHLWSISVTSKEERRLTSGAAYSVGDFAISPDSKWIGFKGNSTDRYQRNITETGTYADLYLMNVDSGAIERLTTNADVDESSLRFSPDSAMFSFSADDDFQFFHNERLYVRNVRDTNAKPRKLGTEFDGDLNVAFWSKDGKSIYSNSGVRATTQLLSVSIETGKVSQITREKAVVNASRDEDSGVLTVSYTDPSSPRNIYAASIETIANKAMWKQLTDSNPQVRSLALGETEAVEWKSSDGRTVEGVLVKPVGYEPGKRYPLIVQIHGGPAGADVLSFIGNYSNYSHVYAAAGYACLMPNYRGSTNYGEKHKMEIGGAGNYFKLGYDDIMSGVDHLIAAGIVDGDKMGVMGWSAGGHWSNWILTHSNRFKAVSTGAGVSNWLSMYAQTDVQRVREFYFGGLPYDNFDHLWDISPLKYIKNAKTPTLIHVVEGDPRVPRPQSEELHMALKKLGVPTEFFVYPGNTHGISEPRNQMVKMMAEFNWFQKWIRGENRWFDWKDLLDTLKDAKTDSPR